MRKARPAVLVTLGKDGVSSRLGMGGTDLRYGTVAAAMKGSQEAGKVSSWKYGGKESRANLNVVNQSSYIGDDFHMGLAGDIWEGRLNVEYEEMNDAYGFFEVGGDTITISDALLGGGQEGTAKLAAVIAHEGTHANGNRIEELAHEQGLTTYGALNAIFGLEADSEFAGQMIAGMLDPANQQANTGGKDFWKLVQREDGTYGVEFDGLHSLVDELDNVLIASDMDEFDENGKPIRSKGSGSFSGSLAEILGMHPDYDSTSTSEDKGDPEIEVLLEKSGATWSDINNRYEFADGRSVDANPHLMTRLAIDKGELTIQENEDGSTTVTIPLRDEYNNSYDTTVKVPAGETYQLIMEGMIDSVMGATTYVIDENGITIYPLSSTLADSDKLGNEDGDFLVGNLLPDTYRAKIGEHAPGEDWAELALRIQDQNGGQTEYFGNNPTDGSIFPVSYINFHSSNEFFINSGRGSLGCLTMFPTLFKPMMQEHFGNNVGGMTTVEISSLNREIALANERDASVRALAERQANARELTEIKQRREQLLQKRMNERNRIK